VKKQAIILGALAVGGFLAYKHFSAQVVQADFMGYTILKKAGYFFAQDKQTGAVSPDMKDAVTVQQWIGAQKAGNALMSWVPGMGDDDMLMPPPGRTITASGQDLGGWRNVGRGMIPRPPRGRAGFHGSLGDLGIRTTYNDVYDAAPYQYSMEPQNDFMPGINGWGSKLKKAVSNVTHAVAQVVQAPANIINKSGVLKTLSVLDPVTFQARLMASTAKIIAKGISNPAKGFKLLTNGLKSFTVTPLMQAGAMVGIVKRPSPAVAPDGAVSYQDANGNPISKEDYDKMVAAAAEATPKKAEDYKGYSLWTVKNNSTGGVLYLINYNPDENSAEGAYDTMAEAKAAIDAVVVPDVPAYAIGPVGPKETPEQAAQNAEYKRIAAQASLSYVNPNQNVSKSTYDQAKYAYDVNQAAREQASMSQAQDDSGYGSTSKDDGTAPIPERVASVQTPSAVMEQAPAYVPPAAPSTASGDGKVGLLVGGGVLAAIAAAVMSK
jgi:hypothetical protein